MGVAASSEWTLQSRMQDASLEDLTKVWQDGRERFEVVLLFCLSVQQLTKASLLAGAGFAFPVNWGQTGRSCHYFSSQLCFGPPVPRDQSYRTVTPLRLKPQTPLRPSRWVSFVTTRSHAYVYTHTYKMIFTVSVVNVMQCNAM